MVSEISAAEQPAVTWASVLEIGPAPTAPAATWGWQPAPQATGRSWSYKPCADPWKNCRLSSSGDQVP